MKERYSYHEMRVQRIQKRTEEVTKELESKREAEVAANKKRRGVSSQGSATRWSLLFKFALIIYRLIFFSCHMNI